MMINPLRMAGDRIPSVLWLATALVLSRILAAMALPVFDDAFITFRYARNLALGDGFVYNPGEWVIGTTAPAFGLLLAIPHLLGLAMPASVITLNILCDCATLCLTVVWLLRCGRPVAALLFGAGFALSPILGRVCVGCMEVNLFLLAGLAAIGLYHRGHRIGAAAVAALSFFLRPEAVLLVAILCLTEFFTGARWRGFVMGAVALAVVLPGLTSLYTLYGGIIPQSVAAKSALPAQPYGAIFGQLLVPDPFSLIVLPVALWGGVRSFGRGGALRTITLWGSAYIVAYALARPLVWPWYGMVTYYTVVLLGALGAADLLGRIPALAAAATSRRGAIIAGALPLLLWGGALAWRGGADPVAARVYDPLRRWCATSMRPGATIAAYDIGAIGYYSGAHIYDLAGLVWPEAVSLRWNYPAIVRAHRPDYLYLGATAETAAWMGTPEMRAAYMPVARFSKFGYAGLDIDGAVFPDGWVQDYILFRRRDAATESYRDGARR